MEPPRITLHDYWKGRDVTHAAELSPRIRANAALTVERVNDLLERYCDATGDGRPRTVNSGWRPVSVQAEVNPRAMKSAHISAEACDLADADETLDYWLRSVVGLDALEASQLFIEHPDYTKGWTHCQTRAPASGRRVFIP